MKKSLLIIVALVCSGSALAMKPTVLKGRIIFSTQDSIYIINLAKKNLELIELQDRGLYWNPSWYDDTRAFFRIRPHGSTNHTLSLYDFQKGDFTNVIEKDEPNYPSVSPDKNVLAFSSSQWLNSKESAQRWLSLLYLDDNRKTDFKEVALTRRQTFSWSEDSNLLAVALANKKIGIFDVVTTSLKELCEGKDPLFNPTTGEILFVQEGNLLKINPVTLRTELVDKQKWDWLIPFDVSDDGRYLFYIGGGNFLGMEYSTIEYFDMENKKTKRLSKKFSIIHGASYTPSD